MKRARTRVIAVVGAVVGAVALALGVGAFVNHNSEESQAQRMCKAEILSQLRSPSTADVRVTEIRPIGETDGVFAVMGYVDAQNSFGATVREQWSCTVAPAVDSASAIFRRD